jgi:hypothetical protein
MPGMKNLPGRIDRSGQSSLNRAGIRVAVSNGMELLGRLGAALGISLILTLLLLMLYQADGVQAGPETAAVSQASTTPAASTPN